MNHSLHFSIDDKGWISPARHIRSPNCNERPADMIPELLVIHNISLPPGKFGGKFIEQFFQNQLNPDEHPYFREIAGLRVSAHLLINREGELTQFVSLHDRAWHAGASSYCGRRECNDFSIGIELEGTDQIAYTEAQYLSLVAATRAILQHYPTITAESITGHCDIAPGRKTDPGESFDWEYYKRLLEGA